MKYISHQRFAALMIVAATFLSLPVSAEYYARLTGGTVELDAEIEVDSATGFKITVGYHLSRFFDLELSYVDLGDHDIGNEDLLAVTQQAIIDLDLPGTVQVNSSSTEPSGYDLAFAARLPIGKRFAIYGKAAVFSWSTDIVTNYTLTNDEGTQTGISTVGINDIDFSYGIGSNYYFTETIALVLEFNRFETGLVDNDMVGLGIQVDY